MFVFSKYEHLIGKSAILHLKELNFIDIELTEAGGYENDRSHICIYGITKISWGFSCKFRSRSAILYRAHGYDANVFGHIDEMASFGKKIMLNR